MEFIFQSTPVRNELLKKMQASIDIYKRVSDDKAFTPVSPPLLYSILNSFQILHKVSSLLIFSVLYLYSIKNSERSIFL